ncbi:DUF664 domain-containing protein [Pseudonocardia sp. ICBG1142]|uniref:mycothiol transferase n=1 Tax=Pseudonocardia sp. ICBG1142 TaxID=2846760 RepID=UPI001CF64BC0|nr:DUF664 domain-containing protein [Pseudonocardia sp. ICBG1142]
MTINAPSWEPPLAGTEAEHLTGTLDRLRTTFRWKVDGLDTAALRTRIGTSSLTLAGLIKHVARADTQCFTAKLSGEPLGRPWDDIDWRAVPDWDFESALQDSPDELYALWDSAIGASRTRLANALSSGGLDQPVHLAWPDGRHANLRRIVFDLVEEYGRHTGHVDLLREAVDGRVGEDPPPDWVPPSSLR